MDMLEEEAEVVEGNVCQLQCHINDCWCSNRLTDRCCTYIII